MSIGHGFKRGWAPLLALAACAAAPPPALPPLNRAVLDFARGRVGQSVGDGQCTSLVVQAIAEAGARRFPLARGGDYVWGRRIDGFAEALPGDILQFRDAVFLGRTPLAGGGWSVTRQEFPHHTAILARVRDRGRSVEILHQNYQAGGRRGAGPSRVRLTRLAPGNLQEGGRVWIYRPVPDPEARPPAEGSTP